MVHNQIFLYENAYLVPEAIAISPDSWYSTSNRTCPTNYFYSNTLTHYGSAAVYSGCQKNITMLGGYSNMTYPPASLAN